MNKVGIPPLQGQKIQMTISELESLPHATCTECGGENFMQAVKLKSVSKFLSQSGRQEVIPMQTFVCVKCKHQLLPKDIEDAAKKPEPELPDDAA